MAPVRECIRGAALLRKRRARQSGGVASGQEDGDNQQVDPDMQARNLLLRSFRDLRPVSLEDFQRAIEFWISNDENMGNAYSNDPCCSSAQYDSSSDEDSED